ncbi:MAG TPA: BrnT family toxin [Ensifer sp.]|nr:BrnT family toxin [Ensifer sp.]
MKIVWDERKRRSNLEKHGLDFDDVFDFAWETACIEPTHSGRMKAVGYLRNGVAVVVYAELGTEAISIVSFRPANRKERSLLDG